MCEYRNVVLEWSRVGFHTPEGEAAGVLNQGLDFGRRQGWELRGWRQGLTQMSALLPAPLLPPLPPLCLLEQSVNIPSEGFGGSAGSVGSLSDVLPKYKFGGFSCQLRVGLEVRLGELGRRNWVNWALPPV